MARVCMVLHGNSSTKQMGRSTHLEMVNCRLKPPVGPAAAPAAAAAAVAGASSSACAIRRFQAMLKRSRASASTCSSGSSSRLPPAAVPLLAAVDATAAALGYGAPASPLIASSATMIDLSQQASKTSIFQNGPLLPVSSSGKVHMHHYACISCTESTFTPHQDLIARESVRTGLTCSSPSHVCVIVIMLQLTAEETPCPSSCPPTPACTTAPQPRAR